MELAYSCEKTENEILELSMRPCRTWLYCRLGVIALLVVYSGAEIIAKILSPKSVSPWLPFLLGVLLALIAVTLFYWYRFRKRVLKAYRSHKTHRDEYRLTDETFSAVNGETKVTVPLKELAEAYRIDDDAIFLKNRLGSWLIIPAWSGHGVGREELAAVFEKAGMKSARISAPRKWITVILVVLFAGLLMVCPVLKVMQCFSCSGG